EMLRNIYDPGTEEMRIPGSGLRIRNSRFISDYSSEDFLNEDDSSINENMNFTYPVFIPEDNKTDRVILLLHGLNERSWIKYLTWAYSLTTLTGSHVILFPISFHMNRSPLSWKDPRAMTGLLRERNRKRSDNSLTSFANIAISKRLTEDPRRFLNSGYQTIRDLEELMIRIRDGKHPFIPATVKVNLFAYSIGAFLAEIIMMADQQNLFSNSKLYMFCGGSVFSNMKGASRLIMDSEAYNRVYSYYMQDFEKEIENGRKIMDRILSTRVGMTFRSMIDFSRFRKFREKSLLTLDDRLFSVGLAKDSVIPADGIVDTLKFSSGRKAGKIETWDFQYNYSHENPFPLYKTAEKKLVDNSFMKLISHAAAFLI
ncbi:MAG: hypothetical protein GX876_07995, partial [Bacteroidales bacterium]|nr:hypothetical protein [Bacteroidales bacterium]